jgi:hypothetical protein
VTGGWQPPTPNGGGAPPRSATPPPAAPPPARDPNALAYASFVLTTAGASVLFLWGVQDEEELLSLAIAAPVALALGLPGLICAWVARQRIRGGEQDADPMWPEVGLAVGGLCSVVALLLFVAVVIEALSG